VSKALSRRTALTTSHTEGEILRKEGEKRRLAERGKMDALNISIVLPRVLSGFYFTFSAT
jgi:hypothetical protein